MTKLMNQPISKFAAIVQTPVYPQAVHQPRPDAPAANSKPKPPKRDNTFSQSRDTRENRGTRTVISSHNAQTFPHAR